jgi:hypothetical protein
VADACPSRVSVRCLPKWRDATTCATTTWPSSPCPGLPTDPPAEDPGPHDWYLKGEDWDYPWGGIQMLGKSDGEQLQAMAPHFLAWGAKLTPGGLLQDIARHGVDFWMSSEDLPAPTAASPWTRRAPSACHYPRTTTPRG